MLKFPRLAFLAALVISASAGFAAGPDTLPDGSINFGSASNFSVLTWGDYSQLDNTFTGPSYGRAISALAAAEISRCPTAKSTGTFT